MTRGRTLDVRRVPGEGTHVTGSVRTTEVYA